MEIVAHHLHLSGTGARVLHVADADMLFWDRGADAPRVQVCVVGNHRTGGDLDARCCLAVIERVVWRVRVPD